MNFFRRSCALFETLIGIESFLIEGPFNVNTFLDKLQSVVTLAQRGATEGERDASKMALNRLLSRAKEEAENMSGAEKTRFLSRVQSLVDFGKNAKPEEPKKEAPRQDPPRGRSSYRYEEPPCKIINTGVWVYVKNLRTAPSDDAPHIVGKVATKNDRKYQDISKPSTDRFWADGDSIYVIKFPYDPKKKEIQVKLRDLEKATQEQIDAARGNQQSKSSEKEFPPINIDSWVVITNMSSLINHSYVIGKVISIPKKTERGFESGSSIYTVECLTDNIGVKEVFRKNMRQATEKEIDAAEFESIRQRYSSSKKSSYSSTNKSSSSSAGGGGKWQIINFARYQSENSDKVYGIAMSGSKYITFWGRYKGPFSTKDYTGNNLEANKVFDSKIKKGYETVYKKSEIDKATAILNATMK